MITIQKFYSREVKNPLIRSGAEKFLLLFYAECRVHFRRNAGGGIAMTVPEAKKIRENCFELSNPDAEDRSRYAEAMGVLIAKTKDPVYMNELGAMYYTQREFNLALNYYEMAAKEGNLYAISNLGYIWYYGRTVKKNYEKAFYYFDKARRMGDLVSAYKIADMYKNGFYVEKDIKKHRSIIEELYPKVRDADELDEPLPEIFTRLAGIRTEEGKPDEALRLYDTARDFLAQRIQYTAFFGDLNITKWMISDIYRLRDFDPETMDLYDLYYLLRTHTRFASHTAKNSMKWTPSQKPAVCLSGLIITGTALSTTSSIRLSSTASD